MEPAKLLSLKLVAQRLDQLEISAHKHARNLGTFSDTFLAKCANAIRYKNLKFYGVL